MELDEDELEATRKLLDIEPYDFFSKNNIEDREVLDVARFELAENLSVKEEDVVLPRRGTEHSAGYDLCAVEGFVLGAHQRVLAKTGVTIKMKENEYLAIVPRSGLAYKKGVTVLNTPGTIDADYYPNEIGVILYNSSDTDVIIEKGDRIAQAILQTYNVVEDDSPVEKTREGGFGSTGR